MASCTIFQGSAQRICAIASDNIADTQETEDFLDGPQLPDHPP